jgi:heat shock protein HslJ
LDKFFHFPPPFVKLGVLRINVFLEFGYRSGAFVAGMNNLVGVYSISFNENRLFGMGAPNRYNGPYTVNSNRFLSIGNIASTLMMAIVDPDGLKEHEYFRCLSSVTRWDLRQGKLELYSRDSILVFVIK